MHNASERAVVAAGYVMTLACQRETLLTEIFHSLHHFLTL